MEDPWSATAEGVIAIALLAGIAASLARAAATAAVALIAQGFALAGRLVGTYFNTVGRVATPFDLAFHVVMLAVLAGGFVSRRAARGHVVGLSKGAVH